ncbi:hypothetical protein MAR_006471, partial [Mya arenaria]
GARNINPIPYFAEYFGHKLHTDQNEKLAMFGATHYGMWDQIRVDHLTEFYLTMYMQERHGNLRYNQGRQPYIQTQSERNHKVKRMWPEVNQRVNYPVKTALVDMVNRDHLDMDDELIKYCLSNICVPLAEIGIERFVNSWNLHRIP